MKKSHFITVIFICLSALLSSCGAYRYQKSMNVKVVGTPDVDFYAENQWSFNSTDGFVKFGARNDVPILCKENFNFIGSTDSTGHGILKIDSEQYKRSKRRILAVKSGYEADRVKLKRTFNTAFLLDILFPPALLFDHPSVLSDKKQNKVSLTIASPHTAIEYFEIAQNETKASSKLKLYDKVLEQDYRNENNLKIYALNDMGVIHGEQGKIHLAFLYFKKANAIDPDCEIVANNLEWLRGKVAQQNSKQERREQTMEALKSVGSALYSTGQALGQTSEQSATNYSTSGTSNSTTSTGTNRLSGQSKTSSIGPAAVTDASTYSDWTSQLIKMNSYYERDYNDSTRRDIQSKMKSIRQKWEGRGYKIPKSEWEDWDGRKK